MTTTDPRARLDEIKARADAATEGPWAAWLDQDDQPHMNHMLMVGNADAVIPDGETWIEGVDVNPVAHTYTPEDREFIAHARTDVDDMAAALTAVLNIPAELDDLVGDHGAQSFANGHNAALALVHHAITTVLGGDRG